MLKKVLLSLIVVAAGVFFTGCQRKNTVTVVKPKKHWFPYDQKKDRRKKRTKTVRMKS